jgi:hypothetical protein
VKTQETTQEHINRIIELRQAVYAHGFGKQRDALSEVVNAMCLTGALSSFPMLSLCQSFERQWHSLYRAVERETIEDDWLSRHSAQPVPAEGMQYYALDGSAWPRPRARTMDDRKYVYHSTAAVKGSSICIGYPYSLLDWVPEAHGSWSLSVSVKRIPSQMTAGEMGVAQIQDLSASRAGLQRALDIVAADGKYSNAKFLHPLKDQRCGIMVRLRQDRVLYQVPKHPKKRKRGRPRIHGKRFAFKEPETWHVPDEVISFEQVKLERWNHLHGKNAVDVPMDVIRASIHLERDKPPQPILLDWQPPPIIPSHLVVNTWTIWQAYVHR